MYEKNISIYLDLSTYLYIHYIPGENSEREFGRGMSGKNKRGTDYEIHQAGIPEILFHTHYILVIGWDDTMDVTGGELTNNTRCINGEKINRTDQRKCSQP